MSLQVNKQVRNVKTNLYKKYVNGKYAAHNKSRIDWVLENVYKKQINHNNPCELKVLSRIANKGLMALTQVPIPILSAGGKIEHLYIADIVVGDTIIEVDGKQHKERLDYDNVRDAYTNSNGYKTIRISTDDFTNERIDLYLNELL